MLMNIKTTISKRSVSIIVFALLLLLWSEREIILYSTGIGNRILQLVYTSCMMIALVKLIYYLLYEKVEGIPNSMLRKGYLWIGLTQLIAFLPMYTQVFMYGDDLWGFSTDFSGQVGEGLYYSRPFIKFLYGFLRDTSFCSLNFFRLFNGLILLIFGCVLYRFIVEQTRNIYLAFIMAVFAVASCTAVDCIAYASIYPINASLLLAAVSAVLYFQARSMNGTNRGCYLFMACLSLFGSFCMYQLGTTIVFLMYCIAEKNDKSKNEKKRFGQAFFFLIYYGINAIIYLLGTKMLQAIIGIEAGQSSRGQINISLDYFISKAEWFVYEVCPQSVQHLVSAIWGNSLFNENNMFYNNTYNLEWIGSVFSIIIVALMTISILGNALLKKSFVYIVEVIVAIPLSFWIFLVLPESTYLTYYAIGIILIFMWYLLDGIFILGCFLTQKNKYSEINLVKVKKYLIASVTLVVALQSNVYAENAWVNYCRDSYEYLANNILSEIDSDAEDINTIVVKGSVSPYVGGRDYVIFSVQNILRELGYDYNRFEIRQLDSDYYISIFNDSELEYMNQVLGAADMQRLLACYMHDEMYSRWLYTGALQDQDTLDFLRSCFVKTGQILEETEHAIIIDMEGFNRRNPF